MSINLNLGDCLEAMKAMPDNAYDLAIVDPPYGININNSGTHFKEKYKIKEWDKETPSDEYFFQLQRVSVNQIIWGGNYFLDRLGNCKCFIVWDKIIAESMSFAMAEFAWTSFKNGAKIYKKTANQDNRIHPTQKPVKLYEWLLDNYAKEGDRILDTHLGSGSIAIACHNRHFSLDAWEIDAEYHAAAVKRYEQHIAQLTLF